MRDPVQDSASAWVNRVTVTFNNFIKVVLSSGTIFEDALNVFCIIIWIISKMLHREHGDEASHAVRCKLEITKRCLLMQLL